MKYHVHLHSLLTFGGLDKQGKWCFPKHKTRLCDHKDFIDEFREIFLKMLSKLERKGIIKLQSHHVAAICELETKSWSFFVTKPTMQTETIETYLARYINKIAVGNSRIELLKKTKEVRLVYNDYNNQIEGLPAPKKIKTFPALAFIHQYLIHVPPPWFQRTRRYGIHASATKKKHQQNLKTKITNNGKTVRTVMEIITQLLKVSVLSCEKCQQSEFEVQQIPKDSSYIHQFIQLPNKRAP